MTAESKAPALMSQKSIWNGYSKTTDSFSTNFNQSSILGLAKETGIVDITVNFAVEYPIEYKNERNFFDTRITLQVEKQLVEHEPYVINSEEKVSHSRIIPPLCRNRLTSN